MGAHQCRHEGAQLVGGRQSRPGAGGNLLGEPSSRPRKPGAKRQAGDSSMGGKAPPRLAERKTTRFLRSPQSGDVVLIAKQARPQVETGWSCAAGA